MEHLSEDVEQGVIYNLERMHHHWGQISGALW